MCKGDDKVKALIVTVAGMSSRFSESLGRECLKCIYYPHDITESILYRLLHQPVQFDRYYIVGGFKYEELEKSIEQYFSEYKDKLVLVRNTYYSEYGSGYSLYCGLKKAIEDDCDEIVFAEGDLIVDEKTFVEVSNSAKSVITSNSEPILANKAVAFYYDVKGTIHYIYDTGHSEMFIKEPFIAIYNSGQIWKFTDKVLAKKAFDSITDDEWKGTNLVFVERYFSQLGPDEYDNLHFSEWINCNRIEDFNKKLEA